uniref:Uncharacterized protein n=1 Tax=Steinernema glaseri TaxID=37863 RepID=A0A1I8AKC5_9BILA
MWPGANEEDYLRSPDFIRIHFPEPECYGDPEPGFQSVGAPSSGKSIERSSSTLSNKLQLRYKLQRSQGGGGTGAHTNATTMSAEQQQLTRDQLRGPGPTRPLTKWPKMGARKDHRYCPSRRATNNRSSKKRDHEFIPFFTRDEWKDNIASDRMSSNSETAAIM